MVSNSNSTVPSSTNPALIHKAEKPRHAKYLNEFRTTQCALFLEQQCQFHRPYTCFYWHFPNQKRRKPLKRSDGTFNYNPDVYCDKYDENTGTCPNSEDCPYAHRNAGDTERRYHPRYFKTGCCIYETTESGACVKNGLHCAFAHGPDDLRQPVYDVREVQDSSVRYTVNLPACLEKERVLAEDPKWNDMFHVLSCYKTELCKKPPRMCRQGYSCPFYHNGKDKRRAPDKFRYKSNPCPNVRPSDDWLDSSLCEHSDNCLYCHTRTEQQFHPEIYNSSKCNDVINSGYCPRGPFCAFAHVDSEMNIGREYLTSLQAKQQPAGNNTVSLWAQNNQQVRDAQMNVLRLAILAQQSSDPNQKRLAEQVLKSSNFTPQGAWNSSVIQSPDDLAIALMAFGGLQNSGSNRTSPPPLAQQETTFFNTTGATRPTNLLNSKSKSELESFLEKINPNLLTNLTPQQQSRRNQVTTAISPVGTQHSGRNQSGGSTTSTSGKGSSVGSNPPNSSALGILYYVDTKNQQINNVPPSRIKSSLPQTSGAPSRGEWVAPQKQAGSLTKTSDEIRPSPGNLIIETDFKNINEIPRMQSRPSEVLNQEQEEMVMNLLKQCLTPTALLHTVSACNTPGGSLSVRPDEHPLNMNEEILNRETILNAAYKLILNSPQLLGGPEECFKFGQHDHPRQGHSLESPSMEEGPSSINQIDYFSYTGGGVGSNRTSGVFDDTSSYFTLNELEHHHQPTLHEESFNLFGSPRTNFSRAQQLSPTASSIESGGGNISMTEPVMIPSRKDKEFTTSPFSKAGNFGPIGSGSSRSIAGTVSSRPISFAEQINSKDQEELSIGCESWGENPSYLSEGGLVSQFQTITEPMNVSSALGNCSSTALGKNEFTGLTGSLPRTGFDSGSVPLVGSLQDYQKRNLMMRNSPPLLKPNSLSNSFSNIPQSPMLNTNRIFSNPGCELERLALKKELTEAKNEVLQEHSKYEETKRERDLARQNFKKLQESMLVIKDLIEQKTGGCSDQQTVNAVINELAHNSNDGSVDNVILNIINQYLKQTEGLQQRSKTLNPQFNDRQLTKETSESELVTPQPRVTAGAPNAEVAEEA